ncbi:MAG: mannitol dehydrogenase family protein [Lachnospiraceae bacterium]|nr:mannitol dehydrogenase family protein [Lachnospiraceae bacterium]
MQLNEQGLIKEKAQWEAAGYRLPQYDHAAMVKATKENPFWVHFGAGNIFRAFQANVVQDLLNNKTLDRGLIAVGGHEAMEKLSHPHDNYSVLVTLKADGSIEKTIVGSVAESLTMDAGYEADFERLKEIFTKKSLQMVSFTVTEKGYNLTKGDGTWTPEVERDLQEGPQKPVSYMGKIASFLYARYQAGQYPVAMVSMDNCSHNGTKLHETVAVFVKHWTQSGLVDAGFADYIEDAAKVSFPWTMIDKITPRPDAKVEALLAEDGISDLKPIITAKKTYIAPFVNAEECQYLVVEDAFPNGRPELEKGGLIFTEKEIVDRVEKMKVCTCLNPLHTALAVFGCLLGFDLISDEMKDETLRKLVEGIGYTEGLPVVVDPGVLDPKEFIDTVLNTRLPNPFMPDTPQRIATDTSQKLAIRFGETIKAYAAREDLEVADLKLIPLVFAGWLRYLTGINDAGEAFELSPDPVLETVRQHVAGLKLGDFADGGELRPILENEKIFGVNLYEAGLAEKVVGYFNEMQKGPGAVRNTLEKYV